MTKCAWQYAQQTPKNNMNMRMKKFGIHYSITYMRDHNIHSTTNGRDVIGVN